jgi:hypothetical protein
MAFIEMPPEEEDVINAVTEFKVACMQINAQIKSFWREK